MTKRKSALLVYNASNVGDEIQSIAASRFLKRIDSYIVRENIHTTKSNASIILNAFWSGNPKNFPPSDTLDAVPIAMHLTLDTRKHFTKKSLAWFKAHEPIGCRDMSTLEFLKSKGIVAYFSGCLTLTLQKSKRVKKQDYIFCVDMPKEAVDKVRASTKREVIDLTRITNQYLLPLEKLELAKVFLQLYQSAHCVISPNLHTIMPCLALETPVLAVNTGKRDVRFTGLERLLNQCSLEDFLAGKVKYDFDNPPANPKAYKEIRANLIRIVKNYTGVDSHACKFDTDNPVITLAKLFYRSKEKDTRALQYYTPGELFKGFIKRLLSNKRKRYEFTIGLPNED